MLSDSSRRRISVFVYFGELIAITEIHEGPAIAYEVQCHTAMRVVVFGRWGGIGIGKTKPARVQVEDVGVVARVPALAPIGCGPVGFFKLRGILPRQPAMPVG